MARKISLTILHGMIFVAGICAIVGILYWALASTSPAVWSEDESWPATARAGEAVNIRRRIHPLRHEIINVKRDLEICTARECTRYHMPDSSFTVDPKDGTMLLIRPHRIPSAVLPGYYRFAFEIQWQNFMGKTYSQPLPDLYVTVVP